MLDNAASTALRKRNDVACSDFANINFMLAIENILALTDAILQYSTTSGVTAFPSLILYLTTNSTFQDIYYDIRTPCPEIQAHIKVRTDVVSSLV